MEIATARIKIKDHKEEITKIIDDTYLRPSYDVKKISDGVYEGHAGIIGVFGTRIIKILNKLNLLNDIESFVVSEFVNGELEEEDYKQNYEEICSVDKLWSKSR